jgi:hypothetical protein
VTGCTQDVAAKEASAAMQDGTDVAASGQTHVAENDADVATLAPREADLAAGQATMAPGLSHTGKAEVCIVTVGMETGFRA